MSGDAYDWLRYTNTGATTTRNLPLSDDMVQALAGYVPQLGIQLSVFSGGQTSERDPEMKDKPGGWTGGPRHNHGNAADVYLYRDGRRLHSDNPEDRAIMAQFITESRRAGLQGIGHHPDYMGTDGIHIGYGNPAVWGDEGAGRYTPDWVRTAYDAGEPTVNYSMGHRAPSATGFREALTQSESSGRLNAYNNVEGAGGYRGHGGRMQFGTARLADAARAGVVPRMTAAEFAQQPVEIQQTVEDWHFADIDSEIDRRGLTEYIGQTVGGVPVTRSSIAAMAHLGGMGGAAQFLRTGGSYNPSDDYGTSLSDYGQRFANMDEEPRGREGVEGPARSLDFDSVLSSDFLRRNSDPDGLENTALSYSRALMDRYDSAVRSQEDLFGYARTSTALTFGALMPDIKDTPEYAQIFPPGTPLPAGADVEEDAPQGPAGAPAPMRRQAPTPAEVAAAIQGGAGIDALRGSEGNDPLSVLGMSTANAEYDMGQPVSAGRLAAPAQATEAAGLVRSALPNQVEGGAAPQERDMAGFLQALGVGFGQLAGGENINIGGVMQQRLQNRMAQEQQALEQQRWEIQQERQARMDALEERRFGLDTARMEMDAAREARIAANDAANVEIARANSQLGQNRLAFDREQAQPAPPARIDFKAFDGVITEYPSLAPIVQAAQEADRLGDFTTRDAILDGFHASLPDLYKSIEDTGMTSPEFDGRLGLMVQAATAETPEEKNALIQEALSGASEDDLAALTKAEALLASPTQLSEFDQMMASFDLVHPDANPAERDAAMRDIIATQAGIETPEMAERKANQTVAGFYLDERLAKEVTDRGVIESNGVAARELQPYLFQAEEALNEIIASEGNNLSVGTGFIQSTARLADSITQGFTSDGYSIADVLAEKGYIPNPEAFDKLDGASRMIAMILARPLMAGQGQVTDGERKQMLMSLLSAEGQSPETMRVMLERIQTLNAIDKIRAEELAWMNARNPEARGTGEEPLARGAVTLEDVDVRERNIAYANRIDRVGRDVLIPSSMRIANLTMDQLQAQRRAEATGVPVLYSTRLENARELVRAAPHMTSADAHMFYEALPLSLEEAPVNDPNRPMPKLFIDSALLEEHRDVFKAMRVIDHRGNITELTWADIRSRIGPATPAGDELGKDASDSTLLPQTIEPREPELPPSVFTPPTEFGTTPPRT